MIESVTCIDIIEEFLNQPFLSPNNLHMRVSDCEELVGVFRTAPLPYPIYTPFLQVRVDSIVSALLALVK